jgi:hypothetical protein
MKGDRRDLEKTNFISPLASRRGDLSICDILLSCQKINSRSITG